MNVNDNNMNIYHFIVENIIIWLWRSIEAFSHLKCTREMRGIILKSSREVHIFFRRIVHLIQPHENYVSLDFDIGFAERRRDLLDKFHVINIVSAELLTESKKWWTSSIISSFISNLQKVNSFFRIHAGNFQVELCKCHWIWSPY